MAGYLTDIPVLTPGDFKLVKPRGLRTERHSVNLIFTVNLERPSAAVVAPEEFDSISVRHAFNRQVRAPIEGLGTLEERVSGRCQSQTAVSN